ncbi:uncharacterized protein LOC131661543 [Vicia villosa]|uniref:uncharacterized protein LOC131661543 n=1 Tax=Vicia villosa TaxID=3911 RepID=UPI00273C3DB1|nr:uncharacterized protein LOC131661543 [Vicia villosa]
MEQDRRLELIDLAIQKHINDNYHNLKDHETQYQQTLSQLLSASQELELSKRDETVKQSEVSPVASVIEGKEGETVDGGDCKEKEKEDDEIVKEVKKVKRQNFVTHCLLSVMIVLTVAWQLSEVSLIMKVKDGINHPFRSFGNMFQEMKEKAFDNNGHNADNKENNKSLTLPSTIKVPDMTKMDVPNLGEE